MLSASIAMLSGLLKNDTAVFCLNDTLLYVDDSLMRPSAFLSMSKKASFSHSFSHSFSFWRRCLLLL
jgi:hypothetical protein